MGVNQVKREQANWLWAAFLIVAGSLMLLVNFDIISMDADLIVGLLFGAGGLVFLAAYVTNRTQWWALIPGFSLLSLGTLISVADRIPGNWGGALFLGGIGLGFVMIYLTQRGAWWPIIPGGALLTLAAVAGVSGTTGDAAGGGLFFLGMGLTFVLVFLLGKPRESTRWAMIPATVLLIFGTLLLAAESTLGGYLWPVLLIALGVYLLFRPRQAARVPVTQPADREELK